jgi:hypothetical protein
MIAEDGDNVKLTIKRFEERLTINNSLKGQSISVNTILTYKDLTLHYPYTSQTVLLASGRRQTRMIGAWPSRDPSLE